MRLLNPWAVGTVLVFASSPIRSVHATGSTTSLKAPAGTQTRVLDRAVPVASYELLARLDTDAHIVHGSGTVRWTNPSQVEAQEIYLHLYLNAFKDDSSLFLRSPFGAGRSGDKAFDYGHVEVERLALAGEAASNLWPDAEWQSGDDTTDVRIPLPKPVAPGETATFEIAFESKLPRIVERTGYSDSYHFVAQWFPKIAKREKDGSWAHFAYHPQSEYYADFGDYEVTIEVPRDFVVGATGKLSRRESRGDLERLTFRQKSVHDFAFTAWDQFVSTRKTIAGVEVVLLHPPGYERAEAVTVQALESALPHFNERYGRYPYPTLTVVHPPKHGKNSGGMEYPTLITTGAPWYTPRLGVRALETVTVHELGHQWFYGLLASNEHAWPFLDEGVNSYAESVAMEQFYGSGSLVDSYFLKASLPSAVRTVATSFAGDEVIGQAASEFVSFRSLGAHVYSRTATLLDTLARVYGSQKVSAALEQYTHDHRFGHPTPVDLLAALKTHVGAAAAQNARRAVFERGSVDYRLANLQSVQETKPSLASDDPGDATSFERPAPAPDAPWLSRVVVARRGELEFPVTIRLTFADGSSLDRRWSGQGETHSLTHRGPSRLVGASVDPEHRVRLDVDLLNNARRQNTTFTTRVWERAVYYFGLLLAWFGP